MNHRDPKLVALLFNECINNRNIQRLTELMTEDYTLILRDGQVIAGKVANIKSWTEFFEMCPLYKNTFTRIESRDNLAIIIGYAFWNAEQPYDPVIWTARIEDDAESNRTGVGLA
jgi:ketosteroid isomerase-like protein